jgi:flagellar hook-associated protein 1
MSLSQALSAALAGVSVTQQGLSVIAGNVANANTPGYVDESLIQNELASPGVEGVSVDTAGINRNLNALLQSQLRTETSGGTYASTISQFYQQLQQVYGTPGVSTSFDGIFNNFTTALQALSTSPSSTSAQIGVVSAAQALAQNLNSMTTSVQQLRTQAEQNISTDVQSANTALAQIAQINGQLQGNFNKDSSAAALEDQRDQDIDQLSQLMNIRVSTDSNNQVTVFTGNGLQLVSGVQASQMNFADAGTLGATMQWSATPSQDSVGTITLTAPSGASIDMIADGDFQSGDIAANIKMRDSILPQAQAQLDEMANQMSQALSNQTTNGTATAPGPQAGFSVNTSNVLPGNSLTLTYTDSGNVTHTITIEALGQGGSLPLQTSPSNPNGQVIGVDFSGGLGPVVAQLNAAFGANLQFTSTGSNLQVVNALASGNTVNSLSATTTATSLVNGSPQLPLFLDGTQPITGALSADGSQTTGLAGRIAVNSALVNTPGDLVTYAANTTAGDATRPNFMLNQMTNASLTFSSSTGIGSAQSPFSGTMGNYLSTLISQQSQATTAASNLQQGQATVVSALQQRFNAQSGVSIDTEMSNLIALQNAYSANARVMSTVQQMMSALMQAVT